MAVLPILTAPDRRLKQIAKPVAEVNDSLRQLMDDMAETMYAAVGIGLAAPQVGISQRVICIDLNHAHEGHEKNPIFIANPVIVHAEGEICWKEGCLSIPEYTAEVTRSSRVIVHGLDRNNQSLTLEGTELLAVCLQHEIDHLNGKLFIDHISMLKRSMLMKKLKKQKEGD
ncbi:MAG: peptide deformylase [Magnetococcales bacterium]|nr:peptide deformylase [Magnetococcales bacterium]MBF0150223.1 peptide deformylase [Magnetococcales bacterium]MBF0172555.1 peptide deformylase [Magnetococcales bacterium]MBF0348465.1 peptide deformylase [Magnetococcales bacterium]MBF0630008.1 peptide deformylase [Magnetococcales bacterium]